MLRPFVILCLLLLSCQLSHAQERQIWGGGTGFGAALSVNEDKSAPVVSLLRISAIAFNGLTPGVGTELGINFFRLHSKDTGRPNDYAAKIIAPDLRLRVGWFQSVSWSPYFDVGIGIAIYHVEVVPPNASSQASLSDATPFLPIGIGIAHKFTQHFGLDANVSVYPSLSDDINPVRDDLIDGWWTAVASLQYIF